MYLYIYIRWCGACILACSKMFLFANDYLSTAVALVPMVFFSTILGVAVAKSENCYARMTPLNWDDGKGSQIYL